MTDLTVPDSPKAIREALCLAQSSVLCRPADRDRVHAVVAVLKRLIDECDRHRPIGPDGKHGNRHTPTCGCDDAPPPQTGRMLHLAAETHECRPPLGRDDIPFSALLPAGPPGSVWRCHCGRLWEAGPAEWRHAGRRLRWRYRHARPPLADLLAPYRTAPTPPQDRP